MKEIQQDKPRITSTVIIGVFLALFLVFTILLIPVSWSAVNAMIEESKQAAESAAEQAAEAGVIALVAAIGIILVIILEFGILIGNAICLPFAIKNRRSTLKPVRVISYVYDGLIGAMMLTATVKIILLFAGV